MDTLDDEPDSGGWTGPWFYDLDHEGEDRISQKLKLDNGHETVGWEISHETVLDREWFPVVRYTYQDGTIYEEEFAKRARDPLKERAHFADIEELWSAWDVTWGEITERSSWEERTQRYLSAE